MGATMADESERARAEWQAVAGGWRRWEPLFQSFLWPMALRMAAVSGVRPGNRVLDVGCGIGDPTLQVAVLVGPHGRVLGIDLSEAMLETARERAAALGLAHVEFRAADVTGAELGREVFDVVLARWSVIYVADVVGALRRLREALVPGGRIAVAAWAPPDANPWITIPMQALARVHPLAPTDPAASGPFQLSADGELARALLQAGFQAIDQERVVLSQFARGPEEYWTMLTDTAGPVAPLLAGLAEEDRARVAREVARAVDRFSSGDVLRIPAQAQLAWGRA
jgi:ubiquinone/menaquinone biosynthesis C-methylase UbiE